MATEEKVVLKKDGTPRKTMGRRKKELSWVELIKLCEMQCTKDEIAACLEMSPDTLSRIIKSQKKQTFAEFYKMYSGKGRMSLRRAQLKSAHKGNPALLIWLGKQYLNQSDKAEVEVGVPVLIRRADGSEAAVLTSRVKTDEDDETTAEDKAE